MISEYLITHSHKNIRLVNGKGEYLFFQDLTRTTRNPKHAWIGNERQLHNVRRLFPHTRDMRIQRVRSL